ncbi:hypothetical protein GCM10011499_26160 [Pelagibacterium lentulum]|uniref:Uncharacterized protein n=1 Tax=Pelagibacterium lentulum TaxID=2029865 RepID=A0A916RF58_9HYPH|nr:hypothetical protein GCM10011499_26160 [Pelagibacterium lentulum]
MLKDEGEVEALVRFLVSALEAADPDAFIMTPVDGERTAIDGSFDLFEVVAAFRTKVTSSVQEGSKAV